MTPTEESALRGAIKVGEHNANLLMEYYSRNRNLRRAAWHAYHQLKLGKADDAAKTLREALSEEDKHHSKRVNRGST